MIIKIFSTIYLFLALLFPYVPSHWNHESLVHTTRKFVHDTTKIGSTSNCHFDKDYTFNKDFNFIKFYTYG